MGYFKPSMVYFGGIVANNFQLLGCPGMVFGNQRPQSVGYLESLWEGAGYRQRGG